MTQRRSPVEVHGPVVRHLRQNYVGYSVRSLAAMVGMSFGHLSRIERGEYRLVQREVFEGLCTALRVEDPRVLMANPTPARSDTAPAVLGAA